MDNSDKNPTWYRQLVHFVIHLRWHYQIAILSGGYLLGAVYQPEIDWSEFISQFANVHLLLFGGATAYNSYWDRDEGPVGGLRNPPPVQDWMRPASLSLQTAGLVWAMWAGIAFMLVYAVSMILFWAYSSPLLRWKGRPVKSLFVIGISTGANSFLLGNIAAGGRQLSGVEITASIGAALIILSLYPLSQYFQIEEDKERGDKTFAVRYGRAGIIRFFISTYVPGILVVAGTLMVYEYMVALLFGFLGTGVGLWIWLKLRSLEQWSTKYNLIMRIKYGTSLSFVLFIMFFLVSKY